MPTANINHGTVQDYHHKNETGIITKTLTIACTRDSVQKKDGSDAVVLYSGRNPMTKFSVEGDIVPDAGNALQGVCVLHPGVASALLNFPDGTSFFGMAATTTTKIIVEEPTINLGEERDTFSFTGSYFPFLANLSNATS
jgi:hypothetical protein